MGRCRRVEILSADCRPVALESIEQAIFKDKDMSAQLKARGVPRNHFSWKFSAAVNALPKAEREKLVADGLIRDDGVADQQLWAGLWSARTAITRHQTFANDRSYGRT